MQGGSNDIDGRLMPELPKKQTKMQRLQGRKVLWRRLVNFSPQTSSPRWPVWRGEVYTAASFSDKLRYLPLKRWDGALENIDARIWRRMSGHYWVTGKMRRAILDGQRAVHWKTCFLSKLGMEIGHSTTCCNFRGDKKLVSQWVTDSSPQLHFPRSAVRKKSLILRWDDGEDILQIGVKRLSCKAANGREGWTPPCLPLSSAWSPIQDRCDLNKQQHTRWRDDMFIS